MRRGAPLWTLRPNMNAFYDTFEVVRTRRESAKDCSCNSRFQISFAE